MKTSSVDRKPVKQSIFKNLLLDVVLFFVFLTIYEERATGITIHEWGALALASVAVVHILWHWQWVVSCSKCVMKKAKAGLRINYVVNILLFVALTAVTFSGLMMSEAVLPAFGIEIGRNRFWHWLHALTADISLGLMALHVGLHWKWILGTVKRLVFGSRTHKKVLDTQPVVTSEL